MDTLGADTVRTPQGRFTCRKVEIQQGLGETADRGDSTIRTESRDIRTLYLSNEIPFTHLVREDIEKKTQRKSWKVGRSQDAPFVMLEQSLGNSQLLGFGTGMKSAIFTPEMLRAMQPVAAKSKPKPKPKG